MSRPSASPHRFAVEPWLVLLVVIAVHFVRLDVLPLRGEESRWTRVAVEMIETGDWIVPRQQLQPFLSRPPMGNWLIALSGMALGKFSPFAVRLPTVTATLLTSLLVYGYTASLTKSRRAGLAAGVAYPTMGHVLQLGQLAESDSLFTAFIAGSLLCWHWAYERGWPRVACWTIGYALAAMATLTKGPQGPIYFAGGVGLFLIYRRDWKTLVSWAHPAGIAAFAAIVLAWQVPFAMKLGLPAVREIWSGDTLLRFQNATVLSWLGNVASYPFALLACMAPWALYLVAYLDPEHRKGLRPARTVLEFVLIALLWALPSCWLVPNSRGRYFLPMYPLVAVLIGVAIDRSWQGEVGSRLRMSWSRFATICIGAAAVGVLIFSAAGLLPFRLTKGLAQPPDFLAFYVAATIGLLAILWRSIRRPSWAADRAALLSIAGLIGLTFSGAGLNVNLAASEDTGGAVAALKQKLPPDVKLVGFGEVHHLFAYYYETPVEGRDWSAIREGDDFEYFCFYDLEALQPRSKIPFSWEPIATIPCERYKREPSRFNMVIARRLDLTASRAGGSGSPVPGRVETRSR
ncbi:MAG: glycosyltransferase family 39 protein [Isosphaeraceae bacterium]